MERKRVASVVSRMKRVVLRGPDSFASRKPVPLDPARPSLAGFPNHLVALILEHLAEDDLIRVSTMCLSFYEQARYVQHRVVRINLDHAHREHVKKRLDLMARRGLLPAVRVLEVTGALRFRVDEEETKEIREQLGLLVPGMSGLRDLHWRLLDSRTTAAFPPPMLDSLPARSRLHVSFFCGALDGAALAARDFLLRLKGNQNLQTVTYEVLYFEAPQTIPKTMRALKEVLLSCPNLTRLFAQSADPSCTELSRSRSFMGLNLADGEIPAPFEEIGLGAYDWGFAVFGRQNSQHPEHLHWAENLDWSRLTTLRDADETAAQYLVPKMTNLKRLELGFHQPNSPDVLGHVCSRLEALSLTGYLWARSIETPAHPLNVAAAKFGTSLRELRVHDPSAQFSQVYEGPSDLLELGRRLPRLETLELDVDIDRGGVGGGGDDDPPWAAYLDAVAGGFSGLRTLELWTVQSGRSTSSPVAAGSARRMFARLREKNRHIQRLILHSGVNHCFTNLECTVAYDRRVTGHDDGDDNNNTRYIRVASPDLGSERNLRLDELVQMAKSDRPAWDGDVTKLDEKSMLFRAALEGPQVRRDWEKWRANLPPWKQPHGSARRTLRNARYMARIAKEIMGGGDGSSTGPPQLGVSHWS